MASCGVGLLTVYYIRNSTYDYSKELSNNRALLKSNGGFMDNDEYKASLGTEARAVNDQRLLAQCHDFAVSAGLVKLDDQGSSNIRQFLDKVSQFKPDPKQPPLSEPQYDRYANDMVAVVRQVVDYANSLNISQQFDEKKRALLIASQVAASLDCQYSFSAYMARINSSATVLGELCSLQKSDAPADLKRAVIDACLPELKRPLRTAQMFKKEQLRLLNNFDITLGKSSVAKNSLNYKNPEDFPLWAKWVQKLPNVDAALRSRAYEAFSLPLNNIERIRKINPIDWQTSVDPNSLGIFQDGISKNRASIDLIVHFAPDLLSNKNTAVLHRMEADFRLLAKPTIQ